MYTPDADWDAMVADEIERTTGSRPPEAWLDGPCDLDFGYDPAVEEARRLGVPLTDYLNYLIDMAVQEAADPGPTDDEIEAMFLASQGPDSEAA